MGFDKFKTGSVAMELQRMYECLSRLEQYSATLSNATRVYQASMQDDVSERALQLIAEYDGYVKKMREICRKRLSKLEQGLGLANHIEGNLADKLGS